jgi:hypothetical protein
VRARLVKEVAECNMTQQYKRAELILSKISKIDESIDRINIRIAKEL